MQTQSTPLADDFSPIQSGALLPYFARDARALDDAHYLTETLDHYDLCILEIECIELNA